MRILDENNNELKEIDQSLGYVIEEQIIIKHHEPVEEVEEQGHWEVVAEYPNGGKDVQWAIDVERVEAKDAYDEYETILRYIPFTEEKLAAIATEEKEQREREARLQSLIDNGVTWDELFSAISEGVNSI